MTKCPRCGAPIKTGSDGQRCSAEYKCGWKQYESWFDQQIEEMTGETWEMHKKEKGRKER